ncbi:MAG TPA: P1 family peptidase, partial [Acidimicrobiales bacterium]|nr:P1 family peptidase [Acidimicrobiales bacterium]
MSIPPAAAATGAHDDLTDVAGVRVGHYDRRGGGWRTGTTVVLLPEGTIGGVDVRGGGPCTRETDALAPGTLVERVHAICLSGGSVFGLAAAGGVTDWLAEQGRGLPVGPGPGEVAPIVPAACLYDLRPDAWARRPGAAFGRAAAEAAAGAGGAGPVALGSVGAGTGARAGGLAGGIGSASTLLA